MFMEFLSGRRTCRAGLLFLIPVALFSFCSATASAANIGTVVPIVGQVSDLAYDGQRNLVYLANPLRNQVEIYSVDGGRLVGSILTGLQPASLAISPDGNSLYSANIGSLTISVINLNSRERVTDYFVGSRPDSIAVGSDGKIVILGTAGLLRLDPITGQFLPVAISPPATPAAGLPAIPASPTPAGFLAGLVATASGNLIIGLSTNRLFVYEVASGTVLRSRNVTGLRAILSASTDGSRFMAGPFLFDTQTLTILGRAGAVAATLTGGSAFSVDGNAVYSTFSTQAAINPLNTNNPQNPGGAVIPGAIPGQVPGIQTAAVLQVMRSSSLTPQLGLRLPEAITSKIISSSDGQNLFANSTSGLLVIPIGQLSSLPVLDVSATNVILSVDMCNRVVATASVQVRNAGGGRMTFGATMNIQNAPVILNRGSGVAPTTMSISFDPRSVTTRGTLQYVVVIVSPEAVNIEPAILVNLNFRDVSDRGMIVPMTGVGVDLQMDVARQRLYIANYTQDQIEVFSLASQTFLPPIRVGNRPRSMAMVNASTLVVANSGAENLSVVDLDAMQEIDLIPMGPVPLNATPLFPRSIAASSNALLFSAVPLAVAPPVGPGIPPGGGAIGSGSIWQLSLLTRSAFPRLNLGIGVANVIQGRNQLLAPADGSAIMIVEGNGSIRLYDPIADTFSVTRVLAVQGFRGTMSAAADGSSYVVDNFVFNSSLGLRGNLAPAPVPGVPGAQAQASLAFGVIATDDSAIRVQAGTVQTPQSLRRFNLSTLQPNLQVFLPEPVMDISPALVGTATGTRQWPPRATALELGANNQTQLLARGLSIDNGNNAYVLTYSGLSVVSLNSAAGRAPSFLASGVVNSASLTGPVSAGSRITIFGSNLADSAAAGATPLPRSLGGVCVTANEVAIPLISTSPTQIDAQLPPDLAAGRVTLTVRSTRLGQASAGVPVAVNATGPGVFSVLVDGQQRALFHASDATLVTPQYPADRDEILLLYATGLGPVTPSVPAGQAGSGNPFSTTTQPVAVTIGGHPYAVLWSGLLPGYPGIYEISIYVPGSRVQGNDLPVVVTAGGVSSAASNAPLGSIR